MIGLAAYFVCVVAGQMAFSLVLDKFGFVIDVIDRTDSTACLGLRSEASTC